MGSLVWGHALARHRQERAKRTPYPDRFVSFLPSFLFWVSITFTRALVVIGSTFGATLGAVIGIVKLVPERTKLILEAQSMVMESLREENKRQAEIIARNEVELEALRERVEELCAKAG